MNKVTLPNTSISVMHAYISAASMHVMYPFVFA